MHENKQRMAKCRMAEVVSSKPDFQQVANVLQFESLLTCFPLH